MEALETAINYWDDALAAYNSMSGGGAPLAVTNSEEAEFCRELQGLLDAAYRLQDQCELMFLDQVGVCRISGDGSVCPSHLSILQIWQSPDGCISNV
jgi:hypothetical protein